MNTTTGPRMDAQRAAAKARAAQHQADLETLAPAFDALGIAIEAALEPATPQADAVQRTATYALGYAGNEARAGEVYAREFNSAPTTAARIHAAAQLRLCAEAAERMAVVHARLTGTTWQTIGDALSITRQAAQSRFGADVERELELDPYRIRRENPMS